MSKQLSLLERLDNALSVASSSTEENNIYLLLHKIGNEASKYDHKTFYGKIINYQSLVPSEEHQIQNNNEEIQTGKKLANKLRNTIILPERGSKHYGAKYRRAIRKEHKILINFYQIKDDGKNIQG